MNFLIAGSPARPALSGARRQLTDRTHHSDRTDRSNGGDISAAPSLVWRLLEPLAYAGACIDPCGALAGQRFRRIIDEEQRQREPRRARG